MKLFLITLGFACIFSACTATSNSPTTPTNNSSDSSMTGDNTNFSVSFAEVRQILDQRCLECHSKKGGRVEQRVSMDTPEEIISHLNAIKRQSVQTKSMPPDRNVTGMTDAEREKLGQWIQAGAPTI